METRKLFTQVAAVLAVLCLSIVGASPALAQGSEVVNINTATADQLTQLPRIGPALAERILTHRKEAGNFKKTEDLILVRGIGEKTFKNLEPFVTVEGKTTLSRKLRTADVEAALAAKKGGNRPG